MDFVTHNILWIAIALISGAMLIVPLLREGGANTVSPTQAVMLINRQNALVLDVRSPADYATGHIANSRNIELGELEKRVDELSKYRNKPVVIICANGRRSSQALGTLGKAGFEQVLSLAGGITAWRDAGQPLSSSKAA